MNLFTGDGTVFWNGRDKEDKKCVDGVYFYRIMTPDPNRRNLTGFVQLIR